MNDYYTYQFIEIKVKRQHYHHKSVFIFRGVILGTWGKGDLLFLANSVSSCLGGGAPGHPKMKVRMISFYVYFNIFVHFTWTGNAGSCTRTCTSTTDISISKWETNQSLVIRYNIIYSSNYMCVFFHIKLTKTRIILVILNVFTFS